MARRRFIVLKDTPELKAGAILEEKCDNGDQDFVATNKDFNTPVCKFSVYYCRELVLNSPDWFEEIVDVWLTNPMLSKLRQLLS